MSETLRSAGEFGLIAGVSRVIGAARGPRPAIPIGDDAAGWLQPPAFVLASTDMLVEGIHFDLALTGWRDLGWKALAVNLSDLAAMGASPAWVLVALALRADTLVDDVYTFYRGMCELAERTGCTVAGGDTVAARHDQVVSVTVLGTVPEAEAATVLRRDAGRPGDRVAVTGYLGASAAGLFELRQAGAAGANAPAYAALATAHRRPEPRLEAGQALRQAGVRCAMDVSDGLFADLAKLCAASGTGAAIRADLLPVHPLVAQVYPDRALEWATGGGEDYELLFAAPPPVMAKALRRLGAAGVQATAIGDLCGPAEGVRLFDRDGRVIAVTQPGWDHFGGGPR